MKIFDLSTAAYGCNYRPECCVWVTNKSNENMSLQAAKMAWGFCNQISVCPFAESFSCIWRTLWMFYFIFDFQNSARSTKPFDPLKQRFGLRVHFGEQIQLKLVELSVHELKSVWSIIHNLYQTSLLWLRFV